MAAFPKAGTDVGSTAHIPSPTVVRAAVVMETRLSIFTGDANGDAYTSVSSCVESACAAVGAAADVARRSKVLRARRRDMAGCCGACCG